MHINRKLEYYFTHLKNCLSVKPPLFCVKLKVYLRTNPFTFCNRVSSDVIDVTDSLSTGKNVMLLSESVSPANGPDFFLG